MSGGEEGVEDHDGFDGLPGAGVLPRRHGVGGVADDAGAGAGVGGGGVGGIPIGRRRGGEV